MRTALFVCTGNTCRSPMAEAIARDWLLKCGIDDADRMFVASAGVGAAEGCPIAPEAENALERLGIPHEGTTKGLTAEMIRKADIVLCMSEEHVRHARQSVAGEPEHEAKVMALDPDGDVQDPVGLGQSAYDELAARFQTVIPQRLKELLATKC